MKQFVNKCRQINVYEGRGGGGGADEGVYVCVILSINSYSASHDN